MPKGVKPKVKGTAAKKAKKTAAQRPKKTIAKRKKKTATTTLLTATTRGLQNEQATAAIRKNKKLVKLASQFDKINNQMTKIITKDKKLMALFKGEGTHELKVSCPSGNFCSAYGNYITQIYLTT